MSYTYTKTSPYSKTSIDAGGRYLDLYESRPIPAASSDSEYVIDPKYNLRPDLLSYDLYGDARLWWVFAERNPNTLKDPVGDFRSGVAIRLPESNALFSALGV